MAKVIATLLAATKTFNASPDAKGPLRHAYDELIELQALTPGDPTLAPPYVAGDSAVTIAANGGSTGNFTITMNFPRYDVLVTTGNIAYDSANAAIQTAIDAALAGETILATYVADDVKVGLVIAADSNTIGFSANGTTVSNAYMVVTTGNVDMDVAAPAVTVGTIGTTDRPAEAVLALFGAILPASDVTPQGTTPADGDYVQGGNPFSMSPALKSSLIQDVQLVEDGALGIFLRDLPDCVG
jgi:hypothetical protein